MSADIIPNFVYVHSNIFRVLGKFRGIFRGSWTDLPPLVLEENSSNVVDSVQVQAETMVLAKEFVFLSALIVSNPLVTWKQLKLLTHLLQALRNLKPGFHYLS